MDSHTPDYIINHKLSSSNRTFLYTAFHNDTLVVIKSPKLPNATLIEFQNLCLISHPFIIRLLDAFPTDAGPALVLPYAEGDDLFNISVRGSGLDEQFLKVIAQRILIGLKYLHSRRMIHRDIKPENIYLMEVGIPGSAVLADLEEMCLSKIGQNLGDGFMGTPCYTAPEVWNEQMYDEKIDLWSFGMTLYVTGVRAFPFVGEFGSLEMIEEIQQGLPNYRKSWGFQKVSMELKELIEALLAFDPAQRPSAEEALEFPWFADLPKWQEVERLAKKTFV
jgi:serine/threonine protein kinase